MKQNTRKKQPNTSYSFIIYIMLDLEDYFIEDIRYQTTTCDKNINTFTVFTTKIFVVRKY